MSKNPKLDKALYNHLSCKVLDPLYVARLIALGADPNTTYKGNTYLHYTLNGNFKKQWQTNTILQALKLNIDPNLLNHSNRSALSEYLYQCNKHKKIPDGTILIALIEIMKKPICEDVLANYLSNAYILDGETISLLINKAGADPNTVDVNGSNYLHIAIEGNACNGWTCQHILAAMDLGINPLRPNKKGNTALEAYLMLNSRKDIQVLKALFAAEKKFKELANPKLHEFTIAGELMDYKTLLAAPNKAYLVFNLLLKEQLIPNLLHQMAQDFKDDVCAHICQLNVFEKKLTLELALSAGNQLHQFFGIKRGVRETRVTAGTFEKLTKEYQKLIKEENTFRCKYYRCGFLKDESKTPQIKTEINEDYYTAKI